MAEISVAEVDQVEADLADAKASGDVERVKAAKEAVRDVRQRWREQEEAAGRRAAGNVVGGDAEEDLT